MKVSSVITARRSGSSARSTARLVLLTLYTFSKPTRATKGVGTLAFANCMKACTTTSSGGPVCCTLTSSLMSVQTLADLPEVTFKSENVVVP